jgi:membrane-associated phospholipid phosphatase
VAIVQAAVYDAVNSIDQSYTPYLALIPAPAGASMEAAAAQAAHDALVGLFPAQAYALDLQLKASLQGIKDDGKMAGIMVGQIAAQNLLTARASDGWDKVVDYTPGANPGDWQPTPPANAAPLAPQWGLITPFCLQNGSQFRPPPPPALTSTEYTADFNLLKEMGSFTSATRTADQTEAALFWQGITTPNSTPAGLWNEIAEDVAVAQKNSLVQNARLFALLDLAEGDMGIACWDAKYRYNFWRPVTAIRAADTDGNPDTEADPGWAPLMATPNHPSYPAGHSTLSTACATVLASFFGTDAVSFSPSWEGLPGVSRSFDSFSAAAHEAGQARIWAGFHWTFDVAAGEALGQAVATYVFQNFLLPRGGAARPPRAGSVHVATPMAATVEATRISLGGPTGFASIGSILADTSGAVLTAGQPAVLPLLVTANSNSVLVDTPATAESRSEGARPQTLVSSVDDVFASGDSWQGDLATAAWMTETR